MTKRIRIIPSSLLAAAILLAVCLVAYCLYITLYKGTTGGSDFIREYGTGAKKVTRVTSIEVVEPKVGGMPFTAKEYALLPRRKIITDRATVAALVKEILKAEIGREGMNHPITRDECYLKMNTTSGFYWLYIEVNEDERGSVMEIGSNKRNATNPNGATTYSLSIYSEVLDTLRK